MTKQISQRSNDDEQADFSWDEFVESNEDDDSETSDVHKNTENENEAKSKYAQMKNGFVDGLVKVFVGVWNFLFVNQAAVSNLIDKIHKPGAVRKMKEDAVQAMASDSPVDRVSRMAFPFAFFMFNVIYWFQYLYERESQAINHGDRITADHDQ